MKFLQAAACVDDMTNSTELRRALDVLRYIVLLLAIVGFAIALFG